MGRFRIPPEVAVELQRRFRRNRRVQIAVGVVTALGVAAALWYRPNEVDLERCKQLYSEAHDSGDTLRVDTLRLTLGDKRDPERGGKEPVRCRVARD